MSRAKLSEEINRLLPGEEYKRIREAILASANYSSSRTEQLRQNIAEENKLKTGLLVNGEVDFTSTSNADLSGFAWVIEYAVHQQAALESITVLAPDPTYPRPDVFVGLSNGTVEYRAGSIDELGNVTVPNVLDTEVLLALVNRNPDESNDLTELPPTTANLLHRELVGLQGGKPAIGNNPAEHYHLTGDEYVNLQLVLSIAFSFVSFDEDQSAKTESQRIQARENIDVYSTGEVDQTTGDLDNLNTADKSNLVVAINQKGQYRGAAW